MIDLAIIVIGGEYRILAAVFLKLRYLSFT